MVRENAEPFDVEFPALALVLANLDCGGTQRVVSMMANSWSAEGHDVSVVTLADRSSDFFRLDSGVRRLAIGGFAPDRSTGQALRANLRLIHDLRRTIRSLNAPVVMSFIAPTNVLVILASLGLAHRIVISERNDPLRQSFGPVWDQLRRWLYPRADVVTANSHQALAGLATYVSRQRLAFLPNPISLPAETSRQPHEHPTVLSVGRLVDQKAHDVLIEAFAALSPRHPDWRLAILGEGPERARLHEKIASLGVESVIRLHGTVPDPFQFYRRADIFVLASRHEGTPNAVLEALGCRLPSILSDQALGSLELMGDARPLIVPTGDAAALEQALERLITDQPLRQTMADAAPLQIAEFQLDRVRPAWETVLAG